jgi:SAM-dependent methyltransferase
MTKDREQYTMGYSPAATALMAMNCHLRMPLSMPSSSPPCWAILKEPGRALREAYRVLKPGGVIGVKEFDHGGDITYPPEPAMAKYDELYRRLRTEYGHDPEGGRKIGAFLHDAGYRDVKMSASYESLSGPKTLRGAAQVFIGLLAEGWSDAFQSRGWAGPEDIKAMSDAWLRFAEFPGALFASTWCEAVAFKDQRSEVGGLRSEVSVTEQGAVAT